MHVFKTESVRNENWRLSVEPRTPPVYIGVFLDGVATVGGLVAIFLLNDIDVARCNRGEGQW
jgi:hypothetical protein